MLWNPLILQTCVAVSKAPVGNGHHKCWGCAWKSIGWPRMRQCQRPSNSSVVCRVVCSWIGMVPGCVQFHRCSQGGPAGRYVVWRASGCCMAPVHVFSLVHPSAEPCVAESASVLSSTYLCWGDRFGYRWRKSAEWEVMQWCTRACGKPDVGNDSYDFEEIVLG